MTIRREQVREAAARHRRRRKHALLWRPILVTKSQLDQLEERGYLDPDRRGERLDECDAIESFLTDAASARCPLPPQQLRYHRDQVAGEVAVAR
jgi:hypothetical protein